MLEYPDLDPENFELDEELEEILEEGQTKYFKFLEGE